MKRINLYTRRMLLIIHLLLLSNILFAQAPMLPGIQFQPISVNNLPEAVQRAVLDDHNTAVIVSAAEGVLPNGERIYRVNYTGTDAGEESAIYYANGSLFQEEESRQGTETDDNDEDADENQEDEDLHDSDLEEQHEDTDGIHFRQP
jgi:hypothetical protein